MRLVFVKLGDVAGWGQAQIDAMVAALPENGVLLDDLKTSQASLQRMQAYLLERDAVFISYNGSFRIGPSPATGAMPPATLTFWYVDGPWVHYGDAAALPPAYISLYCCQDHVEASRYLGLPHRAFFLPHGGPPRGACKNGFPWTDDRHAGAPKTSAEPPINRSPSPVPPGGRVR